MEINDAEEKFLQVRGTYASNQGINRTKAQIHSFLLISHKAKCTEDIIEELNISRGNANMNLRALLDWGLVMKEHRQGERIEFFIAEKNSWEVARRIMAERKKREIEPVLKVLDQVQQVESDKK